MTALIRRLSSGNANCSGWLRSTAYYQPTPVADAELALMRRIDELHDTQLVMKGNYAALPRWLEKLKEHPREWSAQFRSRLAPQLKE